jgi:hypothetical protein
MNNEQKMLLSKLLNLSTQEIDRIGKANYIHLSEEFIQKQADESVNNDYMEYSLENTLNQIRLNEKKIKMDKEHPLTNTLINLKDFMEDLRNYDAPESSDGWSLSNLPSHFWQTLGECISDIEDYIKNKIK